MENVEKKNTKRRRPLWARILKWFGVTAAVIATLLLLVCSLIVWILTPARLTPLVSEVASDYLTADVGVSRVELTFWKTFPRMTLEVDSLSVVSRSLRSLPDSVASKLSADADSLLSLKSFTAGVNVAALLTGELALYDVEFHAPRVNLLQVSDSLANYDILPPSEEKADTASSALMFHKISINRFLVADASPLRFRSLPDSIDVAVDLGNLTFDAAERPRYSFSTRGAVSTGLLEEFNFSRLTFGADGAMSWDSRKPYDLLVHDFLIGLDEFELTLNTAIDFSNGLRFNSLAFESNPWPVAALCSHAPADMRRLVEPLKTDMEVKLKGSLTAPWALADSVYPSFDALLEIPQCAVAYQNLHFNRFMLNADLAWNGADPDASVVNLSRLFIDGRTIDVDFHAKLTRIFSDPSAEGRFKGALSFDNLPAQLRNSLPLSIGGKIKGDADFRLRQSDLTAGNFHKVYAKGELELSDIVAAVPDTAEVYLHRATLRFGSNTAFVSDTRQRVDSLLTLSLKADTMALKAGEMAVEIRGLRAGGGTLNRSVSADTTEINPFGMMFAMERLKFDSPADTLRLRLRDASVSGSLRRYKGEARLPQMHLKLDLGALHFGKALSRVSLRKAGIDVDLHMKPRRPRQAADASVRAARRKAVSDSLAALGIDTARNTILDDDSRRLLRRWDFSGRVQAQSGRLVTPAFPLRNRIENIDLRFNQDSIQLTALRCRAGQSDFTVNGTVSNLRRALTARRDNTLGVRLSLVSDTINVNEIVRALFAGSSLTQKADSAMVWTDDEDGAAGDRMQQMADTAATGPLIIPRNIDARFIMKAANVLYSDLVLHSFKGALMVYDGAVNLRDLSASTEAGSIRVDGLYSAPSPADLQFGMGMKVTDFRLDRLTSIVPAIDSLLPAIKGFAGIVNADVAVTTDLEPNMDINIPSLRAAVKIEGDSLVLLDADTFKSLSKWLFFKNKKRNLIDHMAVEVVVENSSVELYPFMFDIDRYRLGVMGSNDLAMNLNYHVSVLKSPVPFKFGINVKGTPDKLKIRLGGARFKENMVVERQAIADNTRINIVQQIDNVFRRGISKARMGRLNFAPAKGSDATLSSTLPDDTESETLSHADSLRFIRQGLIENPDTLLYPLHEPTENDKIKTNN